MLRRLALLLLLTASAASAQPRPPAAAASSAPAASTAPPPLPPPPAVSDPMLEPPPLPARIVPSWREALTLVKGRSVELRIALADIERAEAQGRQALAGVMPTLSGTANVTDQLIRANRNQVTGDITTQILPPRAISYGAGLSLNVPLLAQRAWYARGTAELNQRIAHMSLQEQRRVLAVAVANALVSVVTTERVAELNRLGLRGALERQALTKRRADLGVATNLDMLRADQDVAAARTAIISGDENLRQSRETLGLALGFSEPVGLPRDLNLDTFAQESARACPRVGGVDERSDLAIARERVSLARRAHRDVELQYYPTVDLRSSYNLLIQPFYVVFPASATSQERIIDRTDTIHSWNIQAVLTWNIFDGGIRSAQLRDTKAQIDQAEARIEQSRRSAQIEVNRAVRGIEVAEQSRKLAEQNRDLARETERLARVGFELGRGTSLELVDAGRRLREADLQLALREFEVVQAKIRALLTLSTCDY